MSIDNTELQEEKWAAIPGYEDYYEVSNLGRVRSLDRIVNGGSGMRRYLGRVRKQSIGTHGYCVVSLTKNSVGAVFCVNRLVLMAFDSENALAGQDSCHNDGNKLNNRLDNLRWDTRAGNSADKIKHGTNVQGSKSNLSKLDETKVREIKDRIVKGDGTTFIGRDFGVSPATINSIKAGRSWRHV